MSRKFYAIIMCLTLAPILLFAQTGKIRGRVFDRDTGDPLPGANVVVVGTSLGAAADVEGNYFILNVPPGVYSIKASFIGYRDVTISNVKVNAGLTSTVDFEMPSEAVEVSEIEIVAERPLINKSATNAVRITTAEQFEKLPVRGTVAVYALQPGVVVQGGAVYIRGGRADEVGYQVEGATARNVLTGGNAVYIIPEALEEAQIQAGGYNAEYGGANAGIITQTLRSGTNTWHLRFQAEADQWPGQKLGEKRFDTFSYGYSDLVATISGPLLKNRVRFFVAGERRHFDDSRRVFWTGVDLNKEFKDRFGIEQLVDSGLRGGARGDTLPRVVIPNGNIDDPQTLYSINSSVNIDFNPLLFRFTWNGSLQKDVAVGARPMLTVLARDRFAKIEQSNNLFTGKLTHLLSNTTFYELSFSYFDRRQKNFDPKLGDNYLAYGDSLEVARAYGPDVAKYYRQRALGPAPYDVANFPFSRPGTRFTSFFKEHQTYLGLKADFTTQYKSHEIKFGGEYTKWSVRRVGGMGQERLFNLLLTQPDLARAIRNGPSDPNYADAVITWRRSGNINAYGYDVFGNKVDSDSELHDGPRKPATAALYVQDKFELGDLVINAGLRWDYFDMDQRVPKDLANPEFDKKKFDVPLNSYRTPKPKTELSPRLGFGFPVTDRTTFHVQYGKFVQSPQFINAYSGRAIQALIYGGGNFVSNPGIAKELEPIRTVQYEIGFNQALTDFAAFDLTAFYRDVKGQLQITKQITAGDAASYNIFQNQDFATTKGLELSLTIRRTNRIAAFVSYTFSDAQGTGSFPNSAVGAIELEDPVPTVVAPLDFSQRHRGSISFDYRFGRGDGGPILERAGVNLLFTFNSGHPYTRSTGGVGQQGPDTGGLLNNADPRGRTALEPLGASTTPWVSNLDVRIDKTVTIGPVDVNFYIYSQNLLNTKNVLNVYQRTGNAFDDGFLTNPDLSQDIVASGGPEYVFLYEIANLQNRQHQWALNGFNNDLFGRPREIRFGFSLEY